MASNEFPDLSGYGTSTTAATLIADLQDMNDAAAQCAGGMAESELTISSGSVTATGPAHTIDTEGDASTDTLTKIQVDNIRDGQYLILRPASILRVVTITSGAGGSGQIILNNGASYTMNRATSALLLQLRNTSWYEIARTNGPSSVGDGQQWFTTPGSDSFVVPTGVTTVWVTVVGGGGGGGGGAAGNSANVGSAGSAGGQSSFDTSVVVAAGGSGGYGGGLLQGGQGRATGGSPGQNPVGATGGYGGQSCTALGNAGEGGNGGTGGTGTTQGGGGGGAGACGEVQMRIEVSVTPAASIPIVVGGGGSGGAGGSGTYAGSSGASGSAGAVLIEW